MSKYLILLFLSVGLSAKLLSLDDACIQIDNENKVDKKSYMELKKYYDKSTQYSLKIRQKDCPNILQFELIILPTKKVVNQKTLDFLKRVKNDAFSIYYINNKITIVANNNRSLLYGIYDFIQKDLKTLFLTRDYEKTVHISTINLETLNRNSEARFSYREIFSGEVDDSTFAKKMALNGRFGHRQAKDGYFIKIYNAFTPYQLIPPKKYKANHKEFFCAGQLDYTRTDMQEKAAKNLISKLDKLQMGTFAIINAPHQDRKSFCTNQVSKDVIKKHSSPSAPYIEYVQSLAKVVERNYPNALVMAEAYQWSRKAPKVWTSLPKNVGVFFSTIEADFSKPINSPCNQAFVADLKEWSELTDNITIWHYITNYGGYFQPFPDIKATVENIKLWDEIASVNGVFLQGAYGTFGGSRADLKIWLYSKLLWNPNLNAKKLELQFLQEMYGNGATEIEKYYELLDQQIILNQDRLYVKTSVNANYLNDSFLEKSKKLLDTALTKTYGTHAYNEVLKVYVGVDYVNLMRGTIDKKGKARLLAYLRNKDVKLYAEGRSKKELINFINIRRSESKKPDIVTSKDVWRDFQEYALKLCCAQLVGDHKASDGSAAMMLGKKSDWGFQLALNQLSAGTWKIYASVRVEVSSKLGLSDLLRPALYYGVHGKGIKNAKLLSSMDTESYTDFLIAKVNVKMDDTANVWIRPPKDKRVKKLYVDRIYAVKQ